MSAFLLYILKVALLTAVFVLLYHLLLRRDTFHRTARIVLVSPLTDYQRSRREKYFRRKK